MLGNELGTVPAGQTGGTKGTGTGRARVLDASAGTPTPSTSLPVIKSLNPDHGLLGGGNLVMIAGDNFTSVRKVLFGKQEATFEHNWTPYNPMLRVTAPAGFELGSVPVTVVTDEGPSSGAGDSSSYRYVGACTACDGTGIAKS